MSASPFLRVRILRPVTTHFPVLMPGDELLLSVDEAEPLIAQGQAVLAALPDPVPASSTEQEATTIDTTQTGVEQETTDEEPQEGVATTYSTLRFFLKCQNSV